MFIQFDDQKTLLCTLPMSINGDKTLDRFKHLVDFVDRSGVEGAPTHHLKIKVYHADVARGDREKSKLKQCKLAKLLMPRQWYLKHLDPEGTKSFRELKQEVARRVHQYNDLIISRTTEGQYTLEDALDLYESFYYIHRQPKWWRFSCKLLVLGVLQD